MVSIAVLASFPRRMCLFWKKTDVLRVILRGIGKKISKARRGKSAGWVSRGTVSDTFPHRCVLGREKRKMEKNRLDTDELSWK